MTHPTAQLPNDTYYDGLTRADSAVIQTLYSEFRKPVTRAVEAAGGSSADGNTFFRVAVIHAACLARDRQLDEEIPVYYLLKNLATLHYRDWATEKEIELPEPASVDEDEATYAILLPETADRAAFRQRIRARRQFSRLDPTCQKTVRELAQDASIGITDPRLQNDATEACRELYRQNLKEDSAEWQNGLPAWVVAGLTDEFFEKAWFAAESLENKLSMGQSVTTPAPETKNTRNVLILIGLLALCYWLWTAFGPSKTPKEVYEENFNPPASIMADRAARMAKDSMPLEQNEVCEQMFQEADRLYKDKSYESAANILYELADDEDENKEVCKSDALYYLAIIGLQIDEPDMTIGCLAKIPDIDRFGEDLYWYQALAFVKIAAANPIRRDVARRAVERARSNTEIPERRAQAEKMLEQLDQ